MKKKTNKTMLADSLSMTCTLMYYVTWCSEYFNIICSSKWQKAVEVIGNKCEAKVPDLVEGMKYQFRVRAVNKGGQSKPSEPSDPITAKDRFGESDISYLLAWCTHSLLINLCSKLCCTKYAGTSFQNVIFQTLNCSYENYRGLQWIKGQFMFFST